MGMLNVTDSSRVQALKEDVLYFRSMLDQTVRQSTEGMNHHVSTLATGKLTLDRICLKKHKQYLDHLNKTQAYEAELHLRSLESELSLLINNHSSEFALEAR